MSLRVAGKIDPAIVVTFAKGATIGCMFRLVWHDFAKQRSSRMKRQQTLATEAFNTDDMAHSKLLTTVGIDYGEISLDAETRIGLYGTPGQTRFSFIWPIIAKGSLGVIILVDHTAQNPLTDLSTYIEAFGKTSDNLIIGVTHIDQRPDRPTSIYRDWLH